MRKPKCLLAALLIGIACVPLAGTSWGAVILADRPDIKIRDANTSIEAVGRECAVTVHPDDWKTVLMSVISSADNSCIEWVSTDGGISWKGDGVNDHSADIGDPSVAILKGSPTRYFVQGIAKDFGQRVVFTDSPSAPFSNQAIVISGATQNTDKGFLCADNTSSPQSGNMYSLWYQQGAGLWFRYSLAVDRGTVWIPASPTPLRSVGVCWGGVISIGVAPSTTPPVLGHVYVAWPNSNTFHDAPSSITFKRSSDVPNFVPTGGIQVTNYPGGSFDPNAALPGGLNSGANSIPSMVTDDHGNIYIAWCQHRMPSDGSGNDAQVYISKSTFPSQGDVWDTPVPATASTANQWLPWIAWDNEAKAIVVMYHDDRNNPNLAEVYLTASYDRGTSFGTNFSELKVSDVAWSGNSDVGEYHGIASGGGVAYPMWCDDRETTVKTFTSPTLIGGIESTSIVPTISHFCTSSGSARLRFQADWWTVASMEGFDKLTVTRPGGPPSSVTASSTSITHQLVIESLPCINGTWTFQVESNKGVLKSQSAVINVSVSCITCPPCPPPCDLE